MTKKRPRMDEKLFELFDSKRENPNESIGEVMIREYPEIEEDLEIVEDEKEEDGLLEDIF